MLFFPPLTDPYQTLGPISSRLANPGKPLNHNKINQTQMRPLHCLLWQHKKKASKGWHTCTSFPNLSKSQATPVVSTQLHHAYTDIKSGFPLTKMTVCPAVSSQKAKPSAHPRTEQANKAHTSSLTPALTGLWVGLPSCLSFPPSHTVKRSHLVKK